MATKAIKEKDFESELIFEYPRKKVTIEVINRRQSPVIQDGEGGSEAVMMVGTSISFGLPRIPQGFENPFLIYANLTKPDKAREFAKIIQAQLEEDLSLEEGDLNVNLRTEDQLTNSIWTYPEYKVKLKKSTKHLNSATLELNLENPSDFLQYLIALASPKCSNTYEKRFDSNFHIVTLRDESIDRAVELSNIDMKAEIISKLFALRSAKNDESRNQLYTIHSLLSIRDAQYKPDRKLNSKSNIEDLFTELYSAVDKPTRVKALHKIVTLEAARLDGYLVFFKAKELGAVIEMSKEFFDKQNNRIGSSEEDVIRWLNKEENRAFVTGLRQK